MGWEPVAFFGLAVALVFGVLAACRWVATFSVAGEHEARVADVARLEQHGADRDALAARVLAERDELVQQLRDAIALEEQLARARASGAADDAEAARRVGVALDHPDPVVRLGRVLQLLPHGPPTGAAAGAGDRAPAGGAAAPGVQVARADAGGGGGVAGGVRGA